MDRNDSALFSKLGAKAELNESHNLKPIIFGNLWKSLAAQENIIKNLYILKLSFIIFVSINISYLSNGYSNSLPDTDSDTRIENHLEKLFLTTQWFPNLEIQVKQGLVILEGSIDDPEKKVWVMEIINNTDGVIAVIDKLESEVAQGEILKPAQTEVASLYADFKRLMPYIASAIILFIIFIVLSFFAKSLASYYFKNRHTSLLLTKAVSNIIGVLFIVLGLYFAFRISGLNNLAITLLGGTGFISLGLGFALKKSFENYVSGIVISIKELLRLGEFVSINNHEGVVQAVTTRATTLIDLDGNHIVIPNSDVLNSVTKNFTRNPQMRTEFAIGIGFEDSIDYATEIICKNLATLSPHVLAEPAPIVAVDNLGSATVNIKVYFWFDAVKISKIKVRSLVIKNIKEALMAAQISMPDDAREIVFSSPLQIQDLNSNATPRKEPENINIGKATATQKAPIILDNEIEDIQKQAREAPMIESGKNILN